MDVQAPILVVEDNENDEMLIRRTLAKSGVPNPRQFVPSGEAAISYLSGVGRYSDREKYPFPALVLLDLKLPVMDGFEVLQWIRAQPDFRDLRVVVLTTSEEIRKVSKAYQLGANSFLVKPLEFENIHAFFATLGGQLWNRQPVSTPLERPTRTPDAQTHQTEPRVRKSTDGHWTLISGW
jgi:CheY-like chemotaxis protein